MGKRKKARYSGIGGQAVLEGIMMRNDNRYSVVVRKSDGVLETVVKDVEGNPDKVIKKIPFIRGVFAFVESLKLGFETLEYSANFYGTDTSEPTWFDKVLNKLFGKHTDVIVAAITMIFSLVLCLGIFIALPFVLSFILEKYIVNKSVLTIIEGVIRILIFVLYAFSISLIKDTRRTFKYHGAEHKCINCIENGKKLNITNVRNASRLHGRCGTNFVFVIAVLTVVLFVFIRVESAPLRLLFRIVLIPIIAGISYEILRIIGRYNNWFTRLISAPGKALQLITTKEPDDEMISVAIAAVEAVYDWKSFLLENFPEDYIPEDFGMEPSEKDKVKVAQKKDNKKLNGKVRKKKDAVKAVIEPEKDAAAEKIKSKKSKRIESEEVFDEENTLIQEEILEDEIEITKEAFAEEEIPEGIFDEEVDIPEETFAEEVEISEETFEEEIEIPEETFEEEIEISEENFKEETKSPEDSYEEETEGELEETEFTEDEEIQDEEEYDEIESLIVSSEDYYDQNSYSSGYEEDDLDETYEDPYNEGEYVVKEDLTKTQPIKLDLFDDYGFGPDDEEVPENELVFEPVDESVTGEIDLGDYEEEEDYDKPLFSKDIVSIPMPEKLNNIVEIIPEGGMVKRIYNYEEEEVEVGVVEEEDVLNVESEDFENIFDEQGRFSVKDTDAFSKKLDEEFDEIMKSLGLDDDI